MQQKRIPGAITRQAFAEDAMAIASWAEEQGFLQDAQAMREFAAKLRAQIPVSHRWQVPA